MCAHHLMRSIIFHTRRLNTKVNFCYVHGFMFQLKCIFHILRSWKACLSHRSISLHLLCTKGGLEVSNRVSNWNKAKNLIFVVSIHKISQFKITVFIYKLIWQSSLWVSVSYVFCEFNRVASWYKGKSII